MNAWRDGSTIKARLTTKNLVLKGSYVKLLDKNGAAWVEHTYLLYYLDIPLT